MKGRSEHIPELDGIRGIAILMVIGFHLVHSMPGVQQGLSPILNVVSRLGQTGVDLFFVLSGYLITGILLKHRLNEGALKNFWGRRVLRIFPLYYATLITVQLFPGLRTLPVSEGAGDGWLWLYLANVPPTFQNIDTTLPHFWSLSVEEQFYLFWPLLVCWLSPKASLRVCVGLIFAAPMIRAIFVSQGWSTFYALPCRIDSLAAGGLLAGLMQLNLISSATLVRLRPWIVVLCLVSAAWFAAASGAGNASSQVFKQSVTTVIYLWLIAVAVLPGTNARLSAILCSRFLSVPGKYSYGLYVIHPLVIAWVNRQAFGDFSSNGRAIISVSMVVCITSIAAGLSWMLVERPFLSLKKLFAYKTSMNDVVAERFSNQ
jgi:peptidoglycan/LPS O-acetylase OafA/YrhL